MDLLIPIAVGALCVGAVFSVVGAWVAGQKGRSTTEGAVIGFMLGPLGALIEALLPNASRAQRSERRRGPLGDAPEVPWLAELDGSRASANPAEAWLKELENRHRPKP